MLGSSAFLPPRERCALFGQSGLEAVAIDTDPVLRGELDGQVEREAVRVVQPEGELAMRAAAHRRGRLRDDGR